MNTTCPVLTDALLDRLRALSASFCLAEGGSHGPDHSERVLQTALTLGVPVTGSGEAAERRPRGNYSIKVSIGRAPTFDPGAQALLR